MDPDVSPAVDDEAHLLQVDECFVYKIPPRQSSTGYRAEIWGLDKPFATCVIRAATVGDSLSLKLLNGAVLFAGVIISAEDLLSKGLDYFLEPVRTRQPVFAFLSRVWSGIEP